MENCMFYDLDNQNCSLMISKENLNQKNIDYEEMDHIIENRKKLKNYKTDIYAVK
jgi:hypothetical protein